MTLKVGILSLGCPRNLVDSETILGIIENKGFTLVEDITSADIAVINTCSFIKEAKEESIDAILDVCELKKQGKVKKIIVAGCLSQQYGDKLIKELKEVDAFVGRLDQGGEERRIALTPGHYSYLKIAEGCNNQCSYCVIPKIKGGLKSKAEADLIKEVKELDKNKSIKELNVIGQDITSYGKDLKSSSGLYSLLKNILDNTKNIDWLRLLYLHPAHFDKRLIELIKNESRICKYVDLPIQHISDRILKLMNRRITRKDIISLISNIRKEIPGVVIRTAVIVGFPSESEAEFQDLLEFLKEAEFERLGAFLYSREEDTAAYDIEDQIKEKIKIRRFDAIMSLQQQISEKFNRSLIGKEFDVLLEGKSEKNGVYLGRTYMDAPEVDGEVFVKGKGLKIGSLIKTKIIDSYEYDLVAQSI